MDLGGKHVLVVGGATGGAVLALLLARAGARVTVLEKVFEPRAVGAGIAIAENGLTVLEALGVGEALANVGKALEGVRIVDGEGRELLRPKGPQPRALMIRRSQLQAVLQAALNGHSSIRVRLGAEVTRAGSDGTVTVREDGADRELSGDLVVGADGVHSRIRESGSFAATVTKPGFTYLRALVGPGLERVEEAWTAEGIFGSFPVTDGTYVYGSTDGPSGLLLRNRGDLEAWKAGWARAYAPAEGILSGIQSWDDLLINEVIRVDCARYHDGKLVLLGDAAHAMSPNVGQGANSAMVDAAVLAGMLREHPDLTTALVAYDARRRPAVKKVQDVAARLGGVGGFTNGAARFLRDRVLMPILAGLSTEEQVRVVLQEDAGTLRQLCGA